MIELLISIGSVMVIAFLISYFIKDSTLNIDNFASAGAEPSKKSEMITVSVAKEFIIKSQALKIVQVDGNSASKKGIKTNDIIAVDKNITRKSLRSGDMIYLEYEKHPNKFKIREFEKVEGDFIFSKTTRNHQTQSSKHPVNTFKGVVKYHTVAA